MNAILNYAYVVLESQVHVQAVAQGLKLTVGYLHICRSGPVALVYDLMKHLRLQVDRLMLESQATLVLILPAVLGFGWRDIYTQPLAHRLTAIAQGSNQDLIGRERGLRWLQLRRFQPSRRQTPKLGVP